MKKKIIFTFFLTFPLSLLTIQAHSADFDVTDGPSLQAALTTAQQNNEADTIRLATGSYDASGGSFTYSASPNNIMGAEENFPLTLMGADSHGAVIDGGDSNIGLTIVTSSILDDSNATVQIEGIAFQNGLASNNGGGLLISARSAETSVSNSLFMGNRASNNGGGVTVFSESGLILYEGNTFSGTNAALNNGGGAAIFSLEDAPAIITRNRFEGNTAGNTGGGFVYFAGTSSAPVSFTDNLFFNGNQATNFGGGASFFLNSGSGPLDVTNNTISGNTANQQGGGVSIFIDGDTPMTNIFNNIIWGNTATNQANDILVFDDSDANNTGSIINLFNNNFSEFVSNCADTGGCTPNVNDGNNLDLDPMFVNPGLDFRLLSSSPLIDQGDSAAPGIPDVDFIGNQRITGLAPDLGAFENPQIQADPETHDFGPVPLGQTASLILTITNPTVQDLEIADMVLSDNSNFQFNTSGGNQPCGTTNPTLSAGDTCTVEVLFNPQAALGFLATLTLSSSDPSVLEFTVTLNGSGSSGGGGGGCSLSMGSSSTWMGALGILLMAGIFCLRIALKE